jgi:radical SAM-linked protein
LTWWLITFAREGGAAYLSHLDTARAWHRTFARAGIDLALSAGMRPKPRLVLGLPLPVGAAALGELLWAEVTEAEEWEPEAALAALAAAAPEGVRPLRLLPVATRPHAIARLAVYECGLAVPPEELQSALDWFAHLPEAPYERVSPKGRKRLDLKGYISDVWQQPAERGSTLGFSVRHGSEGAARPQEFVATLASRLGRDVAPARLVRTRVVYKDLPGGDEAGPNGDSPGGAAAGVHRHSPGGAAAGATIGEP